MTIESKSLEELEQQLNLKTIELEAANKGLKSISYTISHDLRAPLRTIDNFSQALAEDYAAEMPEEAMQHVARIRKATTHMRGMIDELLEFARVSRRKMEIQDFNLSKMAKDIIEELAMENPGRKVEFEIEEGMETTGDKYLIRIALYHLLENAWKFSEKQIPAKITFQQETQNGNKLYSISDNGCGFDMNYYEQLFEPFKRLHTSEEYKGMGIGLPTAQQIIERHEGKIWAESEVGQGSTFYFTLGKS